MSSTNKDARWQTATDMLVGLKLEEPMTFDHLTYTASEGLLYVANEINAILGPEFTQKQARRWVEET